MLWYTVNELNYYKKNITKKYENGNQILLIN